MPIPLLLHGKHAGPTVIYEPFGPWIVPWRFHALSDEYDALRQTVGLIDFSTLAVIECQGKDRLDFLHRLLTQDLTRLSPGSGCQAALLTASATLVAHLMVLADPDTLWLLCDLPRAQVVSQTLERYLFSEAVTLRNHERRKAALLLQGPRTIDMLTHLFGTVVSLPRVGDHVRLPLHHLSVWLIRHALTQGINVLCLIDAEEAETAWQLLQDQGRAFGLRLVGWEALNTSRLEGGVPWFGIDMDESHLLPETGLETVAVSDTKGCYIGQEVIARMHTYGSPSKRLMGVLMEGPHVPQRGSRLTRNEEEVGWLTSTCYSPALRRPIAMGYLKRGAYEPGTTVEIIDGASRLPATVVHRPLVP